MFRKDDKVEALARVPLFDGLSKAALRFIASETRDEMYSPGQSIVKEGSQGGRLFILMEGRAKVFVNGKSRSKLGPGDFFGELSLIDKEPRSATVQAETHVKALSIASWNFEALMQEQWSVVRNILKVLAARIRRLDHSPTN